MKKIAAIILIAFSMAAHAQKRIGSFADITSFASLNGKVYFSAITPEKGGELWILDEATQEAEMLKDIIPGIAGSNPSSLVEFNGFIYFAADDRVHGSELWRTDGTEANTQMFKDLVPGYRTSTQPRGFVKYDNKMYFLASDESIIGYTDLWVTDGTEAGTIKLFDLQNSFSSIVQSGEFIYSLKGNLLLKYSIASNSGTIINLENNYSYSRAVAYNDEFYFIRDNGNISLMKLKSDNSLEVIREFTEPTSGNIEIDNVMVALDRIFFTIREDFNAGQDLQAIWKSDGTTSGTVSVRQFTWERSLFNSQINTFYEFNQKLYFKAPYHLNESLWETNGESSGTQEAYAAFLNNDTGMIGLGETLYFGSGNAALWSVNVNDGSSPKPFVNHNLTGANFFKGKSENHVYFELRNNGSIFGNYPYYLYNNELRPSMSFEMNTFGIDPNDLIALKTEPGKIGKANISIENIGNADLVFSKIEITGKDLYLTNTGPGNFSSENPEGIFPRVIPPGEEYTFGVFFYPSSDEFGNGKITIYSNAGEGLVAEFPVEGIIQEGEGEELPDDPTLDKEILFFNTNDTPLRLSEASILENEPSNSLVGTFSMDGTNGSFNYSLVGSGNDNAAFSIVGDELFSAETFDFEFKNSYTIHVKASDGNEEYETDFIIAVNNAHEDIELGTCIDDFVYQNSGLSDVKFLSDTRVIAVGARGKIQKSEDGGASWEIVSNNTQSSYAEVTYGAPNLLKLDFPSYNVGYAIGRGIFLKTEDAGETWFELRIPEISFDYPENLFFVDEDLGFVFGPSSNNVFKTTNGGLNWIKYNVGNTSDNLREAHFFDDQRGIISGDSRLLSETLDGGITWNEISLDTQSLGLGTFTKLIQLEFLDENVGLIVGSEGQLIRTQDGGATWDLIQDLTFSNVYKIHAIDSMNALVFTSLDEYFKTEDGGLTWTAETVDGPFGQLAGVDSNPSSDKLLVVGFGTSCCSSNQGSGNIMMREDPNSSDWEILSSIMGGSGAFYSGDALGDKQIVFNQFRGFLTENNGVTWMEVPNPPEAHSNDFVQTTYLEANGILAGNYAGIFRSTDNGENWDLLTSEIRGQFQLVDGTMIGKGENNFISVSNDGGATWNDVSQFPGGTFSLNFVTPDIGVAYGISEIYRTTDGGSTWNLVLTADSDNFIRDLDFYGNIAIAGTNGGATYKSTDQGENWSRVNTTILNTYNITAVDENTWLSLEETTDILYVSRDQGVSWINEVQFLDDINLVVVDAGRVFMVGDASAFLELKMKEAPSKPSPINGNLVAYLDREESYRLELSPSDINYNWEVTGGNSITAAGPEASVTWSELGTFTLTVTPSDECAQGTAREVTVEVVSPPPSTIQGENVVGNFSTQNYEVDFIAGVTYDWYVTGATSFTPNQNNLMVNWDADVWGTITLVITDNATGLRTISTLRVAVGNALGVDSETLENLSIYPNPTSEYVIFKPSNYTEIELEMFDVNGKELSPEISKNNEHFIIDVQKLKAGIYFLKIHMDGKTTTRKVIKK